MNYQELVSSPTSLAHLAELASRCLGTRAIAREFNVPVTTAFDWTKRLGLREPPAGFRPWTAMENATLLLMRNFGHQNKVIARHLDRSPRAVSEQARALGSPKRRGNGGARR